MKFLFANFFSAFLFCLAVFSFLICPPSSAFASVNEWETGLENYNLGGIDSQDGWDIESGLVEIVETFSYMGDQSIRVTRPVSAGQALRLFPEIVDGTENTVSFWYMARDFLPTGCSTHDYILTSAIDDTHATARYFKMIGNSTSTGEFFISNNSNWMYENTKIGNMTVNTWHFIEIEFDWTGDTFKGRVDSGAWSSTVVLPSESEKVYGWRIYCPYGLDSEYYLDNLRVSDDSIFVGNYDYIGWHSDLWQETYFYPILPDEYWKYYAEEDPAKISYIFDVEIGTTFTAVWGFHHNGIEDYTYYDDYITVERLDGMNGNIVTTFTTGETDFVDENNNVVNIYLDMPSFTDLQYRHYRIRFHNAADDEDFNLVNFSYLGDIDYYEIGSENTYDTCENFDSTWAKAICHMVVPSPGYFSNEFIFLKSNFEECFPFLYQIKNVVDSSAITMREAGTDAPTFNATAAWHGASIQLWDMSAISPYMETFRGLMSIVLWFTFLYYLMRQLLVLFKPNE